MTTSAFEVPMKPQPRSKRGFAGMDPARVREIARIGGQAAHARGVAHEFTTQEARAAGLRSQSLRHGKGAGHAPSQA
jgi:general stress protein YciG